jgi:hypothetical protein
VRPHDGGNDDEELPPGPVPWPAGKAETTFLSAARPPGRRVTKDQDTLARLAASLPAGRALFPFQCEENMSTASYFKTLGQIEDRVMARTAELRQAERDVALHCSGMACDANSAEEVYRLGLEHLGVSRSETSGLNAASLKIILKHTARRGSRGASGMAFDSRGESPVLDAILKGIKPPRDLSTRNDLARRY